MEHLSYKDVEKAKVENPLGVYRQIAKIAGGDPDHRHEGGMDLSGLSDTDKKRIDKLLNVPEQEPEEKSKGGKK